MQPIQRVKKVRRPRNLVFELANSSADVLASQQLRYQVFAEEMGAELDTLVAGVDEDYYDHYCHHLLVRDLDSMAVVASTRILTMEQAESAGSYYSQDEFDLDSLLPLPGRVMEIGRTCVHPDYRLGGAISVLWSGLAAFMTQHQYEYLMGCASISLQDQGATLNAIMQLARDKYMASESRQVTPRCGLPWKSNLVAVNPAIPPLLKAYLRLGAKICGEPGWDQDFNVADVFILLDMDDLNPRYQRHFISRQQNNSEIKRSKYLANSYS